MTAVYQFIYEDQKILLLIEERNLYFFSGEILYPYPNIKFDYYTDERTFYPGTFLEYLRDFITNIYLTIADMDKNLGYVKCISAKFRTYNRRREIIKETIVQPFVSDIIKSKQLQYAGKTLTNSLMDVFCDNLMTLHSADTIRSQADYQQIFNDRLRQHKYIVYL